MSDSDEMLLRMLGKRFNTSSIPLDLLEDISVLNRIVMDVASVIYLENNPDRKRVRKGFRDDYYISLSALSPGSAVAEMRIEKTTPQRTLDETDEERYIKEAFGVVAEYLGGHMDVETNERYVSKIYPHLNAFGKRLREDEKFQIGREGKMYTYDTQVRRKLIGENVEHLEIFEMYGNISEVDCDTKSFKVTYGGFSNTGRIGLPFDAFPEKRPVEESLREKVFLRGIGSFKGKKLSKVETIEEFTILEPLDIQARLYELQFLEPGWAEGEGMPFEKETLESFAALLDDSIHWPSNTLPRISPTPEGALVFEWEHDGTDFIMDVDINGLTGSLIAFTEPPGETQLDLGKPEGWAKLAEYVGDENGNRR